MVGFTDKQTSVAFVINHLLRKDTVAADEEDDKVNAHHHVGEDGTAVGHDAVVHHGVPVLTGQNLKRQNI